MLPLKWICCCKESFMNRMICQKCLQVVLFLFPHRTLCFGYLLELPQWGDSNKYPKHMLLEVLMQSFLHNFSLTVTSWAKFSWPSNCHYNEFCRCIGCRYKEGWLYINNSNPSLFPDVPTNITVQLSIRDMHSVSETYMVSQWRTASKIYKFYPKYLS